MWRTPSVVTISLPSVLLSRSLQASTQIQPQARARTHPTPPLPLAPSERGTDLPLERALPWWLPCVATPGLLELRGGVRGPAPVRCAGCRREMRRLERSLRRGEVWCRLPAGLLRARVLFVRRRHLRCLPCLAVAVGPVQGPLHSNCHRGGVCRSYLSHCYCWVVRGRSLDSRRFQGEVAAVVLRR